MAAEPQPARLQAGGSDSAIDSPAPHPIPEKVVTPGQWIGFFAMVFGIFIAILDIQIVASSLEQIQAGLLVTQNEITCLQTAYRVPEAVIIPLSGWLARALSTRYLFVLSCGGFTLMSLCCALAWNLPWYSAHLRVCSATR